MQKIKPIRFSLATIASVLGTAGFVGCTSLEPSTSSAIRLGSSAIVSYEQLSEKQAHKKAFLGKDRDPGWGPVYIRW